MAALQWSRFAPGVRRGLPAVPWAGNDGSAPRGRRCGWTGGRRGADAGRGWGLTSYRRGWTEGRREADAGRWWGAHGVSVASPAPPRLTSRRARATTTAAVVATLTTACAMTSLLTLTVFTSGAARYLGGCAT